jgi:L-ascorbate metabolism protein UlaG (beta-lactamase superfamily)
MDMPARAARRLVLTIVSAVMGVLLLPGTGLACGVSAELPPNPVRLVADEPEATPGLRFTFLGHASFLIESPGGIRVVTDYNGYNIPAEPPTIATMNHAHSTHYTLNPDPRITYVLHGWRDDGGPAQIDLTVGDMHVRNLPTNIREWAGGGTEMYGNSVFVFESAGLCVAHLGHLHHLLTADDLAILGPIDIAIVPVDGTWTLSHEDMATVVDSLHAPVTIPMHYFTRSVLSRFLTLVRGRYAVREAEGPVVLSRDMLPAQPEILILPGPPG